MPVIPATQEAEAGELPEPRRRRLRWAEIAPLHFSLGNKSETPSQKKKEEKEKKIGHQIINPRKKKSDNLDFTEFKIICFLQKTQ